MKKERSPYAILADYILHGKGLTKKEEIALEKEQKRKDEVLAKRPRKEVRAC